MLDISDLTRVSSAKTLDDLKLSFFDTSGPHSRGVHNLWFVDGAFAHLTTGMSDFEPTHPNDDQFWVTVDLRNPRQPREVGRAGGCRGRAPAIPVSPVVCRRGMRRSTTAIVHIRSRSGPIIPIARMWRISMAAR